MVLLEITFVNKSKYQQKKQTEFLKGYLKNLKILC